jgi:hypothetical protein
MDVKLTRDLFLFGRKNGYLIFRNRNGKRVRIPVNWKTGRLKKQTHLNTKFQAPNSK